MNNHNINNGVEFKSVDINVSKISFDVACGMYADIIEIFRLEGMLPPAIMNGAMTHFHDATYSKLETIWNRLSGSDFEKKLPLLSHLPLASLRMLGHIKISFRNIDTQDYHYIDYSKYATDGIIHFTTSINQQMVQGGSANALLYHVVNSVALLKSDAVYTIHHTKITDTHFQSWYGMHLPFSDAHRVGYDKGVVSLIRKI
jgi:hypothetical protein